jgi:8-oxo-dGTP diphosphatase
MPYTYDYPRPALTVDAVVFRKNEGNIEVLLIRRKFYPFEGMWALPGGFVEMEETVEAAVDRELAEETSLKAENLEQLHVFSAVGRDPRGRTVSVTFYGMVEMEKSEVCHGDDASEACWFPLNKIPEMAFDHIEAVDIARKRMGF